MKHVWFALAALAGVAPAVARADAFSIGAEPVWFVTGGGTGGGTVAADHRGAFVGGELSLVRLVENRFVGLYADAYYDFGAGGLYATIGPELGLLRRSPTLPVAVGLDGGAALRTGDDAIGATGRLFVSLLGSFAFYGRYIYLDGGEHVVQLGVTLKFPLAPPFGAGAP
jgi:hypothetical protein